MIHPAGGTTFCYIPLAKYLDSDRPIYAIQDPGLESNQYTFLSFEKIAGFYLQEIKTIQKKGPYLLGGLSYGGVIAFEITQQLLNTGESVEFLGLIDSWSLFSDKFKDRSFFEKSLHKQQNDLKNKLHDSRSISVKKWFDLQWARMKLLLDYKPKQLNKEIHLYKASEILEEYQPVDEPYNHWQQYSTKPIRLYKMNGDHNTIIEEPNVIKLAQVLNEDLKDFN